MVVFGGFFFLLPEAWYLFQSNGCFTHLNTMTNGGWEMEGKAAPGHGPGHGSSPKSNEI